MSWYHFTVGEGVVRVPDARAIDAGFDVPRLEVWVADPLRDSTAGTALLEVRYRDFREWAERAGLRDLFFLPSGHYNPEGLMPRHPGAALLTLKVVARFITAHESLKAAGGQDAEWAGWFARWGSKALERCAIPTLYSR